MIIGPAVTVIKAISDQMCKSSISDLAIAVLIKKALTASDFVALVLTIHLSVAVERLWNTLLTRVAHPLVVPETTFAIDEFV